MGMHAGDSFRTKLLPAFVAALLVLAFMPVTQAYAAEATDDETSGQVVAASAPMTDGSQDEMTTLSDDPIALANWGTCQVSYDTSTGALTIGPGEGASVTNAKDYPWHTYRSTTSSVTFTGKVTMPEGSSLASMFGSDWAVYTGFYSKLTTITGLANLDTTGVTNMATMFFGCSSLTSLDVSALDTSKVVECYGMFYGCSSLTSLDVSRFDTSAMEDISYLFYGCTSLESIDLWSSSTTLVTDMNNMFYGCTSLESLDLSSLDTSSATDMTSMFNRCMSLQEVKLGATFSFTGDGTTSCMLPTPSSQYILGATGKWVAASDGIVYAAEDVPSKVADTYTAQVDMSVADWGTCPVTFDAETGVLTIGAGVGATGARASDYPWDTLRAGITKVEFSGGVTMPDASLLRYMFSGCDSLTSVDLSKLDTTGVTDMRYMFSGCSSLESVDLSHLDTAAVTKLDHLLSGCSSLTSADLSKLDLTQVTDMSYLLLNCESLTSVNLDLPKGTPALTNMNSMFTGCSSLAAVDVSALDTTSVTNMTGLFGNCSSLVSANLRSFDTKSVTNMSGMFSGCTSLASVDLSSFDTSSVKMMGDMFGGCTSLASLDLSTFKTPSLTKTTYMFNGCSSLVTLDISSFDTAKVTSMYDMFLDCSKLASVKLGKGFNFNGSKQERLSHSAFPTPSASNQTGKWLSSADGLAYAPDAIPDDVAATYTPEEKTYTLALEATEGEWSDLAYGYATSNTVTYTVKNNGNTSVTSLVVAMSGDDADKFTIDATDMAQSLEPGASTTFKVSFGTGCDGGTYAARVRASSAEDAAGTTVDISQKVVAPTPAETTSDTTTGTVMPLTGDASTSPIALLLICMAGTLTLAGAVYLRSSRGRRE